MSFELYSYLYSQLSYYEKFADGTIKCIDSYLPFSIPDNWEWCNLSMIGHTNIGLTYKPENISPDGMIVLRSCNIVGGKLDYTDIVKVKTQIRDNQLAEENDILICARNGSRALVGKCAIIPKSSQKMSFGAYTYSLIQKNLRRFLMMVILQL